MTSRRARADHAASARRRRFAPLALILPLVLLLGACASDAPQDTLEPEGPIARSIDNLWNGVFIIAVVVFVLVEFGTLALVIRFRRRKHDNDDDLPAQTHGNTRLEIAWTVIPTVIVGFLAAYSGVVLADIEQEDADRMPLDVTAQQFAWSFTYPEQGVVADELHVPVGRQLEITLRAEDVLHSFWVPEWRIKRDLVPGAPGASIADEIVITPDKEGSFSVVCTEYCGTGHSTMRVPVEVESEAEFLAWVAKQDKLDPNAPERPPQDTNGPTVE
jgi:cytochrome c oxidase subunit 2